VPPVPRSSLYGRLPGGFDSPPRNTRGRHRKTGASAADSAPKNCPYATSASTPSTFSKRTSDAGSVIRPIVKRKATSCDLCIEHAEPSCVYACPHDAAHRVDPNEFFKLAPASPRQVKPPSDANRLLLTAPGMAATLIRAGVSRWHVHQYSALSQTPSREQPSRLVYGVRGLRAYLCAALLGLRKKVPVLRIGRAQTWMRGHLCSGSQSPSDSVHCGFAWKGSLASRCSCCFLFHYRGVACWAAVSAALCAKTLMRSVPMETSMRKFRTCPQLCDETDLLAASISATGPAEETLQTEIDPKIARDFASIYAEAIRPVRFFRVPGGRLETPF